MFICAGAISIGSYKQHLVQKVKRLPWCSPRDCGWGWALAPATSSPSIVRPQSKSLLMFPKANVKIWTSPCVFRFGAAFSGATYIKHSPQVESYFTWRFDLRRAWGKTPILLFIRWLLPRGRGYLLARPSSTELKIHN